MPDEKFSGPVAIGLGVKVFEKHIGLRNKKKNYSLNDYSVSPDEFEKWLKNINNSIIIYGSEKNRNLNIKREKDKLKSFQRGVYKKKLAKSKILALMMFIMPSSSNKQISANEFSKHNFTKLKKNYYIHH